MTDSTVQSRVARVPDHLLSRLSGVLFSPRPTFESVIERPRAGGVLLLVTLVATLSLAAFLSTDIGQQALLDRQVARLEWFGVEVTDERYAGLEQDLQASVWLNIAAVAVGYPAAALGLAAALPVVFGRSSAAKRTYGQTLAVVAHAGVLFGVQQVVLQAWNYSREAMGRPFNLAVFLPMLDEGSVVARALGTMDLFVLWLMLVLAVGVSVLYGRATRRIFVTLAGVYVVVAVVIAVTGIVLGGA